MKSHFKKSLVALIGAVVFPLAALFYLAALPKGARGSLGVILLQVAIVMGSVFLFAVFLARLVEQMNGGRVRRWLESVEGQEWLLSLPEEEQADFLERLDGKNSIPADFDEAESPVDSSEPSR